MSTPSMPSHILIRLNFTGLDPTAIPANSQNVICLARIWS